MCNFSLADPDSVTRPGEHRRVKPVPLGVAVVGSQPQQKVTSPDHLSPHGRQQPHTPQLWRGRRPHSAHSGREGRLDVRRAGEDTAVRFWRLSFLILHHYILQIFWNLKISYGSLSYFVNQLGCKSPPHICILALFWVAIVFSSWEIPLTPNSKKNCASADTQALSDVLQAAALCFWIFSFANTPCFDAQRIQGMINMTVVKLISKVHGLPQGCWNNGIEKILTCCCLFLRLILKVAELPV